MKYITILFLFLVPLAYSQSYGESLNEKNLLIDLAVAIAIFFIVWFIIAKIEAVNKVKDLFYKKPESLIGWAIGIFIALLIVFHLAKNMADVVLILGIVLKIVLASFVSTEADKLNRNKSLWFVLGLIEHFSAFIVLGLSPKYIAHTSLDKEELKKINEDTQAQLSKLDGLKNSGLLNTEEYIQKVELLKEQYYEKIKFETKTPGANNVPDNKELLSQLEQAYKAGILTEEEFNLKSQKLTNN